jgi:hypothetical protein
MTRAGAAQVAGDERTRRARRPAPAPAEPAVIPRTLRAALACDLLPESLRRNAGLPEGAQVGDLRYPALGPEADRDRIRRRVCALMADEWPRVRDVRILDRPWPASLDPRSVDWPVRVRRCLVSAGLIDDRPWFSELTYGRLVTLTAIGIRSAFDIALSAESAVDVAYASLEAPPELVELARRVAASTWATRVGGGDPRFRDLLGSDGRTVAERLRLALGPEPGRPDDWLALAFALPAVVDRVGRIERMPLEPALREYVEALHGLDGPSLDALLARLGLDGRPPRPLTVAVDGSNLSSERLRQLAARLQARRPSHPVHLPALDRALELLENAAPCPADYGAALLPERGVATASFHPESVLKAAELCGREPSYQLEPTRAGARIVTDPMPCCSGEFVRLVSKRVARFGAVSLAAIVGVAAARGLDVSESRARNILDDHAEAHFLDDDWFWLPKRRRNRVATLTGRILAVASALDVETLRAGIARAYAPRDAVHLPSPPVITELYAAHPDFSIDRRGRIRLVRRAGEVDVLNRADRILLAAFSNAPHGLLERAKLRDACIAQGLSRHAVHGLIARSPLLDSPARNRWCLRGARIGELAVSG